jgi:glutamate N-acetyltransferase / amino-acid N-acetyltransferase
VAAVAVRAEAALEHGVGVCAPRGFRAGVAAAGIRGDGDDARLDVAVVASDVPASAAGVFTRNTVKAAPVVISQLTLRRGTPISAIVINAGNANACTGPQGLRDALVMCTTTADALDVDPGEVLVCSTGVIGRPMPMQQVTSGVRTACHGLNRDGERAARAILTTDRRPKLAGSRLQVSGVSYRVAGMAKGAGMLRPDLATLLAIVTTDAPVPADVLQHMVERVADDTFNCLTVDGDTSTNDSFIVLANGAAGGAPLTRDSRRLDELERSLREVCESLSEQIVADAEGASRYFRVDVAGAGSDEEARTAARTVAESPLVKTAMAGSDPNWGRIVAALGRSGARFTLDRCTVALAGVEVFRQGSPCPVDLEAVRSAMTRARVDVAVNLGAGTGRGHAWGCELTAGYVSINADYTT